MEDIRAIAMSERNSMVEIVWTRIAENTESQLRLGGINNLISMVRSEGLISEKDALTSLKRDPALDDS